ncbi:hypothetical protein HPP92_010675 [Vanilla planifolia]|uniref:Uncharacterized protein n=1 Tax=Vanilla planifolia TaxID=51239 RepID=A0A835V4A7_VANPL|nr:hypothetical protein HPP92_010675 [Vanilla planifolia]
MDADAWSRLSAASKRRQSALQQPFDLYFGFEDMEGEEEDSRDEFPCPFCDEDFDIVGLCRHMDYEHPDEAKNGELMDGNFQSLLGGTSSLFVPSQAAPDPLLSSFISNVSIGDSTREAEPESLDEEMKETSELKVIESCAQFLSYKDQKEIAQRSRTALKLGNGKLKEIQSRN